MQRGEEMPVGWMIGRDGKPLTDPKRADEGVLLPIGDYKGYGLSLIIGLLAGMLNGAAFGRKVIDFVKEPGKATNTGHAIVADIGRGVRAGGGVQASDRYGDPRHARRRNDCPGSSASGFPASRAISSARIASRTASRCRSRCATASMPLRAISASRR